MYGRNYLESDAVNNPVGERERSWRCVHPGKVPPDVSQMDQPPLGAPFWTKYVYIKEEDLKKMIFQARIEKAQREPEQREREEREYIQRGRATGN